MRADARPTRRVLRALTNSASPTSTWEVAQITRLPTEAATGILTRLAREGHIARTKPGVYVIKGRAA